MGSVQVVLSERLRMLADMVTPGSVLADVGCDHGFLSIYLVQAGVCPRVIAMDVRQGPLAAAERHIREWGLEDYIETRLSDGLAGCAPGEADTMVCAGMGGRLMERILTEGQEKAGQMGELILQPQSELPQFRAFLRRAGVDVVQERAVYEDGKYYFAMKARPRGIGGANLRTGEPDREQRLYDQYGRLLLKGQDPVLLQYLRWRRQHIRGLAAGLKAAPSGKAAARLEEMSLELEDIEQALRFYE